MQYQTARGVTPTHGGVRTLVGSYDFPLLFEPGDSWEYSVGIDWAGEMVMRVTGLSLEDYMKQNIWAPLGMECVSFFPKKNPELMLRLMDMSQRDCGVTMYGTTEDVNANLVYTDDTIWGIESTACHGGAGGYGSLLDYQKMLHSICADDGKLLRTETIAEMFKPQLTDAAREKLNELTQTAEICQAYGGLPQHGRYDWGIGGILTLDAFPGCSAGSMSWGGYPNLIWFVDRSAGMSGILGSQINPPGDLKIVQHFHTWVRALYSEAGLEVQGKKTL